jgi:hypothetical protein
MTKTLHQVKKKMFPFFFLFNHFFVFDFILVVSLCVLPGREFADVGRPSRVCPSRPSRNSVAGYPVLLLLQHFCVESSQF